MSPLDECSFDSFASYQFPIFMIVGVVVDLICVKEIVMSNKRHLCIDDFAMSILHTSKDRHLDSLAFDF
jgi:hypothetical protein